MHDYLAPGVRNAPPVVLGGAPIAEAPEGSTGTVYRMNERQLEQLVETVLARLAPDGAPPVHAFACSSGDALWIAYMAILTNRHSVQGRAIRRPPEVIVPALSFGEMRAATFKAFARAEIIDVERETGCIDLGRAEAAITERTEILSSVVGCDHAPDMEAQRELCRRRELGSVVDSPDSPLACWNGIPLCYWADVVTVSGQQSELWTPPPGVAFVITADPILAGLIVKLRNPAGPSESNPPWWPNIELPAVLAGNGRSDEIRAIIAGENSDWHLALESHRAEQLQRLRDGLDDYPQLPWRMLPAQPQASRMFSPTGLVFDPAAIAQQPAGRDPMVHAHRAAWQNLGWGSAAEWLARELVTHIAPLHPTPEHPESGYDPRAVPWADPQLKPRLDPDAWPAARDLSETLMLLAPEQLARDAGADQVLGAMLKMNRWVTDPDVHRWAIVR